MSVWEEEEDEELEELGPQAWRRGLALGFLAMLPQLMAYELSDSPLRSTAELLLLRALSVLGSWEDPLRRLLIAALALVALLHLVRAGRPWLPGVGRIAGEGIALALLLGPALVGLLHLFHLPPPPLADPESVPAAGRAAFVFGAAAWEELFFRVGLYSALYLLMRRLSLRLGAGGRLADGLGEGAGLVGSALLFAGAHLASWTAWLGPGGEPYDPSLFTWRLFAGILLGLVYRWRGPGVASWTHGSFNLALLLGAGPDVFL